MDKTTFVTIVVTAMIAALTREIAGALFSMLKNLATSTTVRDKIKTALTPNKIVATINLSLMLYCVWTVHGYVYSSEPLDRFAVFNIAYFTCLGFASLLRLEAMSAQHAEDMRQLRRAQEELEFAKQRAEALKPMNDAINAAVEHLRFTIDGARKSLSDDTEIKSLPRADQPPENVE